MSNCKNVCKLCKKLIISQAVNFTAGTGLVIQIPEGSYNDGSKYCIVVARQIAGFSNCLEELLALQTTD